MEDNILLGQEGRVFVTKYRYGEGVGTEYKRYTYKCGKYYTCTGFIFTDRAKTVLNSALEQYYNETGIKRTLTVGQIEESLKNLHIFINVLLKLKCQILNRLLLSDVFCHGWPNLLNSYTLLIAPAASTKQAMWFRKAGLAATGIILGAPYDNTRFAR